MELTCGREDANPFVTVFVRGFARKGFSSSRVGDYCRRYKTFRQMVQRSSCIYGPGDSVAEIPAARLCGATPGSYRAPYPPYRPARDQLRSGIGVFLGGGSQGTTGSQFPHSQHKLGCSIAWKLVRASTCRSSASMRGHSAKATGTEPSYGNSTQVAP